MASQTTMTSFAEEAPMSRMEYRKRWEEKYRNKSKTAQGYGRGSVENCVPGYTC